MFWIGLCVLFLVIFGVFFYLEEEYNAFFVEKDCIEQQAAGLRYTYRNATEEFVKKCYKFQ